MLSYRPFPEALLHSAELRLTGVVAVGDTLRLSFAGEIDLSNAATFADVVLDAMRQQPHRLVQVGFAEVSFLDSSGIRALLDCWRSAQAQGRRLAVTEVRPPVRRVLEITGVLDLLGAAEAPTAP